MDVDYLGVMGESWVYLGGVDSEKCFVDLPLSTPSLEVVAGE